jgi:ketosteroid isomerase-like protein
MTNEATSVLRQYLDAISDLDTEGSLALFAEDAVITMMLMPGEAATPITGKAVFAPMFGQLFAALASLRWVYADINATDDPELAVARAASTGVLRNGKNYGNVYAIIVRVRDGKIVESQEYFSPIAAGALFEY